MMLHDIVDPRSLKTFSSAVRGKRLHVLHVYPERTSLRSMPPTLKRGCAILLRSRIATVGPEAFCSDVNFTRAPW